MASVFDVAKYILNSTGTISTWKLQKLCYYSQAWHYTWTEKPLFEEDFEAWVNGPVCPDLYRQHRGKFLINEQGLQIGNKTNLTEDEKDSIDVVLKSYGSMSPYELRELTHSEEPWKLARTGLDDDDKCQNIITKESMGLYYGKL